MASPSLDLQDLEKSFASLIPENASEKIRPSVSKFVKKLNEIPEVSLPPALPRRAAVALSERGLVGQFTGLWPSPRTVLRWVERNWNQMVQGKIAIRFCGRGFFTFLFESVEDRNLIFRNGPYFMDSRGLYLNRWTPDFDPEMDVPNAVPVWVRLPHLPLHCWGDESVKAIGNAVGKFIDRSEPKENMHACARICVEVDLGKGLPEAIKLKVDQWAHIQQVDYEQLPFKCKVCHEYGHFANRCSKNKSIEINANAENTEEEWETVKRKKANPPPEPPQKNPLNPSTSPSRPSRPDPSFPSSSNPFESLSAEDPPSPPPSPKGPPETPSSPPLSSPPPPLVGRILTRNKSKENIGSTDPPRKAGRKSNKEIRDETAAKEMATGTQQPMDSFLDRTKGNGEKLKEKGGAHPKIVK